MIYLIQRSEEQNNDKVISLSKLKTIEYRIFRKLREKLRKDANNPVRKNIKDKCIAFDLSF